MIYFKTEISKPVPISGDRQVSHAALKSSLVERQLERNRSRAFKSMTMIDVSRQTDLSTMYIVHDSFYTFARWFYLQA